MHQLCLYSVWTHNVGHWCILLFFSGILFNRILLSTLPGMDRSDIALQFLGRHLLPFFNNGITSIFEKYNGVFSSFTILRNIKWSMLIIGSLPDFSTCAVIRSDPGALLFFSKEIAFLISSLDIISSFVDFSVPGMSQG